MTEFKNASTDMRNATRTFMEAKDLVSRVNHARGYFPVVGVGSFGVGSFDGFQTITPRGSRQTGAGKGTSTGMNSQTGKGRGRGTRKRETPSRFPTPIASQIQSDINRSCEGRTDTWTRIQPGQCLLCHQMGHLARDCPNRGTRDDSGINLKRAFGSFDVMTGDKDVSSLVLTTTPQQEVEQGSDFTMSHVPVAIWLCLLVFVEQFLFHWCHRPALSSAKHGCSVGTQTEPKSIPPPSPTQQRTPRTVLITENGMKSTKVFHSSTVCNTSNRSAKVTSFRQCTQCPSPSVAVFAEWAAFAVKNVKGYALLDTGASRSVGGYMMVQYVIDCLSRNTAPPWLESADPAVSFTFAGGEKAHSETPDLVAASRWHELFAVHIVPSEVTPILLGLDMLREFGLVINADSANCYSTKLRCRIPVTVLPSGHLALVLTPSGSFETVVETATLVKETDADMAAAVQEDLLE